MRPLKIAIITLVILAAGVAVSPASSAAAATPHLQPIPCAPSRHC